VKVVNMAMADPRAQLTKTRAAHEEAWTVSIGPGTRRVETLNFIADVWLFDVMVGKLGALESSRTSEGSPSRYSLVPQGYKD
jgi:hypothetical protein